MGAHRARRRLEQERDRLEGLRDSHMTRPLAASQQEDSSELSSYDQHPADAGSDTVEREQAESIADERLEARPETLYCIEHQAELERSV